MEITNFVMVFVALILSIQVINAESEDTEKPPYNPLENLILDKNPNHRLSGHRVKRQYGPYDRRIYPYPVPILVGGGVIGYGGGFGRGFGGRGFGGRGFGGRGFGGRGFGGRGFGGRGGGFGGRGGGFGGRGGGFGGGRGGRG